MLFSSCLLLVHVLISVCKTMYVSAFVDSDPYLKPLYKTEIENVAV